MSDAPALVDTLAVSQVKMEAETLSDTLSDSQVLVETLADSVCQIASVPSPLLARQLACRPVPMHFLACHLASVPPPLLTSQSPCRPVLPQVSYRVDQCLRIAECVA